MVPGAVKGLRLYAAIALRNLSRNPRRTVLNVTAIGVGLVALICFQALKQGLHLEMIRSTVGLDTGSMEVVPKGFSPGLMAPLLLPRPKALMEELKGVEGVIAVAPRLRLPALARMGGRTVPVVVTGVDPRAEAAVTIIAHRMVEGRYGGPGVVVGRALAREMGLGLGAEVVLSLATPGGLPAGLRTRITGIYATELATFDRTHLFLPIARLQKRIGAPGGVTALVVKVPLGREREVARRIEGRLRGAEAKLLTWDQLAPDVKQIMEINDATMELLMAIVFAIVALGIVNTMTTILFERFRELGVIIALGTPPSGVVAMLELESLFLALSASVLGTLTALAICWWLTVHGLDLSRLTSANQHMATSHILRARVEALDVVAANLVSWATAMAATLYPALKAARLDPVEALRHQ